MRAEALGNVFCYSRVERVVTRAKDIHEMHSNRIASFEFVVRGWLRSLRLIAFAHGHSTRRAMLLQPCLQLAARSVVMREALVKAESNGDPNGIRTRVTAVKGRCPRPLDDRVTNGRPIFHSIAVRQTCRIFSARMQDRPSTVQCGRSRRDVHPRLSARSARFLRDRRDLPGDSPSPAAVRSES